MRLTDNLQAQEGGEFERAKMRSEPEGAHRRDD